MEPRSPVTEQYLRAAPVDWNKGWGVKTLFAFDPDYWKLGIHRPKMKTKHLKTDFPDTVQWLNGSGREMEEYFKFRGWRSITRTVGYDWLQVNHYAVKSVDSYALRRLRGNVNNKVGKYGADYWALQDRNEVADDTMLRYSARRSEILAALLADPVLRGLAYRAIEMAEARLAELTGNGRLSRPRHGRWRRPARCRSIRSLPNRRSRRDREKIAAQMSEVEREAHRRRRARTEGGKADGLRCGDDLAAEAAVVRPFRGRLGGEQRRPVARRSRVSSRRRRGHWSARASSTVRWRGDLTQIVPQGRSRCLDLGAGFGFVAVRLSQTRPDLTLMAAGERRGLPACAFRRSCPQRGRPSAQAALVRTMARRSRTFRRCCPRIARTALLVSHADLTAARWPGRRACRSAPNPDPARGIPCARGRIRPRPATRRQSYQLRYGAEPTVLRWLCARLCDP